VNRAHIVAGTTAVGQRIDRFLCDQCHVSGRAGARRLIEAGAVRINGRRAAPGQRLAHGDRVELDAEPGLEAVADAEVALSIVHEDAWLVVADKPSGMPSHPLRAGERGTLASGLLARYPEMRGVGYSPREPGLVHRLDTDTSGLMLCARDARTFGLLKGQLEHGEIDKRYLALCMGEPAVGLHEAWLSARGRRVTVRAQPFGTAQAVRTEVLRARVGTAASLVEVRVGRARRHQIRAHLAALGHPILGDALYGGPAALGLGHHFLHASELGFRHPVASTELRLRSELPVSLQRVLAAFELSPAF
jgi:23S rRNA pseudouridine1911/1915/1917 synthase